MTKFWCGWLFVALASAPASAGSLYFGANEPRRYDFADLTSIPPEFGRGEFTFEIWVKLDDRFPVGPAYRGTIDQLANWSDADPKPYASPGWWLPGNWLIDGHSRPEGFDASSSRAGTFSLQFYGGGRLRWMFADSKENMPAGMVYAVQAHPASTAPTLLDGKWHHVAAVRRWREPEGAMLELWIDGKKLAETPIPLRTDMRMFWDKPAHPDDPPELGGWAFGAEVMTAWGVYFTQYEDFKGWIDEMRFWSMARSPKQIEAAAAGRGRLPARSKGLSGRFSFDEGQGTAACDSLDPRRCLMLHRTTWSDESAPG